MLDRVKKSEEYIGSNKDGYFEGWYFRHIGEFSFAVIVGMTNNADDKHAFVQYIDTDQSTYFRYSIEEFSCLDGMVIRCGDNTFTPCGITLNLVNDEYNISGEIRYTNAKPFEKSVCAPSAMGMLSYLKLPCNHIVVNMSHECSGTLCVNGINQEINDIGYIEKDYGSKFPRNYIWMHAANQDCSIMLAVARPIMGTKMRGHICLINYKGTQYNFSLYNCARISRLVVYDNHVNITLHKGDTTIEISAKGSDSAQNLIAPGARAMMNVGIKENLSAEFEINLVLDGEKIDLSELNRCALEIVLPDGSI